MKLFQKKKKEDDEKRKSVSPDAAGAGVGKLRNRVMSLPGDGFGFSSLSADDKDSTVQQSDLDKALQSHFLEAHEMAEKILARSHRTDGEHHPTAELEEILMETYNLEGAYFIGHTNTDLDSVASAIGGAALFNGIPTRSEVEVNGEIEYALKHAGLELPTFWDDIDDAKDPKSKRSICLVDHNEPGQMIASLGKVAFPSDDSDIDMVTANDMRGRIKGVIDHHALSDKFSSAKPIYIDIKPWGSACSIIANMFVRLGRPMPREVAVILLCGILSDTINLTSPTTTHSDKIFATLLAFIGEVEHPNVLAQEMFKAKTAFLCNLPAYSVVRADQKNFDMGKYLVGWATIEVNDPLAILAKSRDLLFELRVLKKEKKLDFVFLSVVDLQKKKTVLLLCGSHELLLAREVFNGPTSNALDYVDDTPTKHTSTCKHNHRHSGTPEEMDALAKAIHLEGKDSLMDIGSMVSRKLEFIPPVKDKLTSGWSLDRQSVRLGSLELAPHVHTEHACIEGQGCSLQRTFSLDANAQDGME